MKKLLPVLFILFCCTFKTKTQAYVPFPDSGVVFTNSFYSVNSQMQSTLMGWESIYMNGEDTLINGTQYTIVRSNVYNYRGGLRSDSGKVYIVPPDSLTEHVLYDFTIDTLVTIACASVSPLGNGSNNIYCEPPIQAFRDTSGGQDTITLGGITRRVVQTFGARWIEGIGNTNGFLSISGVYPNSTVYALECVTLNGTVIYTNQGVFGTPSLCNGTFGLNDQSNPAAAFVAPNPAKEFIKIKGIQNSESARCTLMDLMGKAIATEVKTEAETLSVDVRNIPAGMYLLRIENDNRFVVKKVLIEK